MTRLAELVRQRWIATVVGLATGLLVALLALGNSFEDIENRTIDYRFIVHGDRRPRPDVVLVGITDESLRELGAFPFPRGVYARFLDRVAAGGARVIAFDVLFTEASADPAQDRALAQAIARAGNVVLAAYGDFPPDFRLRGLPSPSRFNPPLPALAEAAGTGVINVFAHSDGYIRSVPTVVAADGGYRWGMAFEIAHRYLGLDDGDRVPPEGGVVRLGSRLIPVDRWGRMLVNFAGGAGNFRVLGFHDVVAGRVDPEFFRDKAVLLGPMAAGLGDVQLTPFAARDQRTMFGVEIHANAVNSLLGGDFLAPTGLGTDLALSFLVSLAVALLVQLLPPGRALLVVLAAAAGYVGAAQALFEFRGLVVPLTYPVFGMALSYTTVVLARYTFEEAEKRRVARQFSRYVTPQVVQEILRSGGEVGLGGRLIPGTVLFADLRGFTALAERMEPTAVVGLLNRYLAVMAAAVFRHGGTLDKFMGDEVMALYNAPLEQPDHALRAVATAVDMQGGIAELREQLAREGLQGPGLGVGICSGYLVVGNIGTAERLEYTAIGDTVNTAARLRSAAAAGEVLVNEAVREAVRDRFTAVEMAPMELKGKAEAVRVWRVTGGAPGA